VFELLCFLPFIFVNVYFFIFQFCSKIGNWTKTKIGGGPTPDWKELRPNLTVICLGVLEGKAVYHICNQRFNEYAAMDKTPPVGLIATDGLTLGPAPHF